MPNVVPLSIHNAHVKTADVQIKALTVSGKQVTLAVFRQLLREPLINHDGSLAGIPWGLVNYHPDKCADGKRHYHAVWQLGDQLRRDHVVAEPEFSDEPLIEPGTAVVLSWLRRWFEVGEPIETHRRYYPRDCYSVGVTAAGLKFNIWLDGDITEAVAQLIEPGTVNRWSEAAQFALEKLHARTVDLPPEDKLNQALMAVAMKEAARRRKVLATIQGVAQLPQLFIAL